MRILHLASGNRWTGAAAPAFAEVEALREAGVDAHYAYVGGYKLEKKIGRNEFAHASIEKAQNPAAFLRSARAIRALGAFDLIHAHLTYDHLLAAWLARRSGARLARTWHSQRALRPDAFSRALAARTDLLFAVNETLQVEGRSVICTPPPVDQRLFTAGGPTVRAIYGIPEDAPLALVIGKVAPDRGFELSIEAYAAIRQELPDARLMVIGHGPHEPLLRTHARLLSVADGVVWAGYHESHLPDHYRSADVLLFTSSGSDEGHRAILEAMACGLPPVAAPIDGVSGLVRGLGCRHIAIDRSAAAIADAAIPLLCARSSHEIRSAVVAHSLQFGYAAAARRLVDGYSLVGSG